MAETGEMSDYIPDKMYIQIVNILDLNAAFYTLHPPNARYLVDCHFLIHPVKVYQGSFDNIPGG